MDKQSKGVYLNQLRQVATFIEFLLESRKDFIPFFIEIVRNLSEQEHCASNIESASKDLMSSLEKMVFRDNLELDVRRKMEKYCLEFKMEAKRYAQKMILDNSFSHKSSQKMVVVIEPGSVVLQMLIAQLNRAGYLVHPCTKVTSLKEVLPQQRPLAIIVDDSFLKTDYHSDEFSALWTPPVPLITIGENNNLSSCLFSAKVKAISHFARPVDFKKLLIKLESLKSKESTKILICGDNSEKQEHYHEILSSSYSLLLEKPENILEVMINYAPDVIIITSLSEYQPQEFISMIYGQTANVSIILSTDEKISSVIAGCHIIDESLSVEQLSTLIEASVRRLSEIKSDALPIKKRKSPSVTRKRTARLHVDIFKTAKKIPMEREEIVDNESTQSLDIPTLLNQLYGHDRKKVVFIDKILHRLLLTMNLLDADQLNKCISGAKQMIGKGCNTGFAEIILGQKLLSADILEKAAKFRDPEGNSIIPGYEIEKNIGYGANAVVYLGHDVANQRKVAVKVFVSEFVGEQSTDLQRFFREFQVMKSLAHPGIARAYDAGEIYDFHYIVMEYLQGETLQEMIDREKYFEEQNALNIIYQIATPLYSAWKMGIVHRDLKPSNIIMTSNGIKICDFGLAKPLKVNIHLTQVGTIVGTPYYMSPEQCAGEDLDYRADIYALAVMLYSMTTGHKPFAGSNLEVIEAHLYQSPPSPHNFSINLSRPFEEFLMKLLAKKPDDRCLSIEEFKEDLYRVKNNMMPLRRNMVNKCDIKNWIIVALSFLVVILAGLLIFS